MQFHPSKSNLIDNSDIDNLPSVLLIQVVHTLMMMDTRKKLQVVIKKLYIQAHLHMHMRESEREDTVHHLTYHVALKHYDHLFFLD